ncbi:MAG: sensor histidine kinase [Cryomorphaceae bacterium]|nr:histidine kinase [Flavobacteriales bacterium]
MQRDSYLRNTRDVSQSYIIRSTLIMDKNYWYNVLRTSAGIALIPVLFGLIQVFLFENDDRFYLYNTWWQWLIFNAGITFLLTVSASAIGMWVHLRLPYEKTHYALRLSVLLAAVSIPAGIIMYAYHKAWCGYLLLDCSSREELFTNITLAVVITIIVSIVFEGAHLFELWKKSLVKESLLREENLKSQLEVLKSQINPHFLFNTLNSIYIQSAKNPEIGRESILNFSELLSYQLYDSRQEFVRLDWEVEYLQNYIELEQMRQGDAVDLKVDFDIPKSEIRVAPLLFTPIIENAFKYGLASGLNTYCLRIVLDANEEFVTLVCKNEFRPIPRKGKGGLGLENLRKRLELIYQDRHWFKTEVVESEFIAELKIQHTS